MIRHLYALPDLVQQVIAIAMLIGIISIPIFGVKSLYENYQENALEIENKRFQLGKLISFNKREVKLADVKPNHSQHEYLPVGSAAGHAADLQTKMKLFARQAGVTLASAGNAQPIKSNYLDFAGARLRLRGTYKQVASMILAIETHVPYLLIKEAQLRQPSRRVENKEPDLEVNLAVYVAVQVANKQSNKASQ